MTAPSPHPRRTLRLALALRGGVSLAVWIGGAVAELDLFRRASLRDDTGDHLPAEFFLPAERGRVEMYRTLLADSGFDKVEIDILAGASAGGLNAVLLGVSQGIGIPLDGPAHRTWIQDGGIWELLWHPGFGRIRSILSGDGRFFHVARTALERIAGDGTALPTQQQTAFSATDITVDLAATVVGRGPDAGGYAGNDAQVRDHDHRAGFTFTSRPGRLATGFSTVPQPDEDSVADFRTALDLLALAARASSSFPGAFEAASIYSAVADDGSAVPGEATGPGGRGDRPRDGRLGHNAAGVFPLADVVPAGSAMAQSVSFRVIDGGIFDNIPVDRAMRAIQRAPSSDCTTRRLIYLDPSPALRIETPRRRADPTWLNMLVTAGMLKIRKESADDELDLVRGGNEELLRQRSRVAALAGAEGEIPLLGAVTARRYARARIGPDARRLARLLREPWVEVPVRPPGWAAPGPITALHAAGRTDVLTLGDRLTARYGASPAPDLSGDLQAVIDGIALLILWLREIDAATDRPPALLPVRKAQLYRMLITALLARREAVYRPVVTAIGPDGTLDGLSAALDAAARQQRELRMSDALWTTIGAAETGAPAEGRFLTALGDGLTFGGTGTPLIDRLFRRLDELMAEFRTTAFAPAEPAEWWSGSIWRRVADGSLDAPGTDARQARALVRTMAIIELSGTDAIVAFASISGTQRPAVMTGAVDAADRNLWIRRWLREVPRDRALVPEWRTGVHAVIDQGERRPLAASSKLAGTSIANFSGFLDWRWRANDWRWGRLDAAAGIVGILDDAGADNRTARAASVVVDHRVADLQRGVLEQEETFTDGAGGTWRMPELSYSFADLSPQYRYSLAARLGPLVGRALAPRARTRWTPAGQLGRAAVLLARIVAFPLLFLAEPLRFAAVGATVLTAVALGHALSAGAQRPDATGVAATQITVGAVLAIVAPAILWSAFRGRRRRRLLREAIDGAAGGPSSAWHTDLDYAEESTRRAVTATWVLAGLALTGGLALAGAGVAAAVGTLDASRSLYPEGWVLIGAVVLGLVAGASARARTVPADLPRPARRPWHASPVNWAACLLVTAAGAACTAPWWPGRPWRVDAAALWPALAAAVAAILLWLALHGWAQRDWLDSLVIGGALLTAGVAAAAYTAGASSTTVIAGVPCALFFLLLGAGSGTIAHRDRGYGEEPVRAPITDTRMIP